MESGAQMAGGVIIDEFTILINIENEYTLHEMKKILETVYKSKTEKPVKKMM